MKPRKAISLLCAAVMLTACAEVPEDVRSSAGTEEAKIEYITLAELPADIEAAKAADYNILTVTENLNITVPEKLSDMKMTARRFNQSDAQKLIDHHGFTGKAVFEDNTDPRYEYLVDYENHDDHSQFIIEKWGFVSVFYHWKEYDHEMYKESSEEVIFVKDIKPDDTVTVNGTICHLSKLVSEAEKTVTAHAEAAGENLKYVPVYVYCEPWRLTVRFVQTLNGVSEPCYNAQVYDNETDPVKIGLRGAGHSCSVFCQDGEEVTGLTDCMYEMPLVYVGNEFDKLASLSSAMRFLDSYLAPYMKLLIDDISVIQMDKDHGPRTLSKEESEKYDYNTVYSKETHPCWQFIMHTDRSTKDSYAALIDCTTGELSFAPITFG